MQHLLNKCNEVKKMNNKLLKVQRNIDKIRKSSAIPTCIVSEQEQQETFKRLSMQLEEEQKAIESGK